MGHGGGQLKQAYRALADRLDAGPVGLPEPKSREAWAGWREILEILYTPEEAALAARLPIRPASLKAIGARVGVPLDALRVQLDRMADKGLVMDLLSPTSGKVRYLLSPPVVGFFEFSMMRAQDSVPKKRMAEALDAYCHGDDAFAREVFGEETVIGRALVHESALAGESPPDVLDWERATAIVEGADRRSISLCYCRHKTEHLGKRCDAPVDICLSLGAGADFVIRRGFGRAVDKTEALEALQTARDLGLVHLADNVMNRPTWICSCCGCCCGQLSAINEYDLRAVNPSGFQPSVDDDRCAGCSRCARACPIGALVMKPLRLQGRRRGDMRPGLDAARCIGCGVCVGACRKGAMQMIRRPTQPYVPTNAVEKAVRMALERGRLADLLFDEGQSRGSRFLNHAVQALVRLPGVDRVVASEQARSRFVRFVLGDKAAQDLAAL